MLTSDLSRKHGESAVVGKVRILSKLGHLVEEIEATLEEEKTKYLAYLDYTSTINLDPEKYGNMQGWIEALEYVLKQIEVLH